MTTFIMLTRLNEDAVRSPRALEALEKEVVESIRKQCPDVKWIASYATLGPYDYLDVFEAHDVDMATKVSALIRTFGHARTETWVATEWSHFKNVMRGLPAEA